MYRQWAEIDDGDDILLHVKTSKRKYGTHERVTKRVLNRKLKTGSSFNPSKLEDGIYFIFKCNNQIYHKLGILA